MGFLTNVEREYLTGARQFTRDQGYYIKSRLIKKLKMLYGIELPLLKEHGYLDLAACSKNLAARSKIIALNKDNQKTPLLKEEKEE